MGSRILDTWGDEPLPCPRYPALPVRKPSRPVRSYEHAAPEPRIRVRNPWVRLDRASVLGLYSRDESIFRHDCCTLHTEGVSGIGVIRLSGPDAVSLLDKVFTSKGSASSWPDRTATYGVVCDPASGKILDDGIALVMRAPRSYTGEDVVELSLHGSPVILDMVERMLVSLGARPARRGEFTRRAFLSGRLDLLQAEAVIDLIEAVGPAAAEEARGRLDRSLSEEIGRISGELKDLLAVLEAHIDFDEDDLDSLPDPRPTLTCLVESMSALLKQADTARLRREGVKTVIAGKPNVGKSTLFNALLRTERAIVTPHPGTTRDSLDERLLLGEEVFVLCDTAGVRESPEPVEEEGIRRARSIMSQADIIIAVVDGSAPLGQEDLEVMAACSKPSTVVVLNKADLGNVVDPKSVALVLAERPRVCVSAKMGTGMEELERLLCTVAQGLAGNHARDAARSLTARGAILLESARIPLQNLLDRFHVGEPVEPEIVSLEVRRALEPLEEITGQRVDEGILDRIFERFCVGK